MTNKQIQSVPQSSPLPLACVDNLHNALNDSGYICSQEFSAKIFTSIYTKPVSGAFLYGMAGTGKSYLPMVLANVLNRQLFVHQCTQGTREEDLLVKIMPSEDTTSGVKVGHGKILQAAIESNKRPVMLMLDEWDKTRPSVDGFFLDFLQYGRLSLPGVKSGEIQANLNNLMIFITANDEREFHEALLRRFPMIQVNPIEPTAVITALNLTHKNNVYLPQMIDLYTRSIQAKMPKPATIQELRQMMDAIDLLGSKSDWDALVYQYITKTPENHTMLSEQGKVKDIKISSLIKIAADDYGVDVVPTKSNNEPAEMPDLRDLSSFEESFEASQYIPENVVAVLKRDRITENIVMSANLDKQDPDLASLPEWGAITKDYVYLTDTINANHIAYLDKSDYFYDVSGEVKITDKYVTRAEINRLLHSKWLVYKRDNNEIIARHKSRGKTDLRYREGFGMEIVTQASNNMNIYFKLNANEYLSTNIEMKNSDNIPKISFHDLNYVGVNLLYRQTVEHSCVIGNSVLKSYSNHLGYCQGMWLRSPSGSERCSVDNVPHIEELVRQSGKQYKVTPNKEQGFTITSNNFHLEISSSTQQKLGSMKMLIEGYVDSTVMSHVLRYFSRIPLYKCFQHDGKIVDKLQKAGFKMNIGNPTTLEKDGIYAHIVYDYVIICSFLDNNEIHNKSMLSMSMKSKLNRIDNLERKYNTTRK
tara:strand:+ start:1049 stop:3157 length:2109 start_codon:yes stop_codon:yes gene_type:complete